MRLIVRFGLLLLVGGCTFADLDLTTQNCPCATGWTCNADDICVRGSNRSDGGRDGDASSPDAPPADVQRVDGLTGDVPADAPPSDVPGDTPTDPGADLPDVVVVPTSVCDDPPAGTLYCTGFEEPLSGWSLVGEPGGATVVTGDAYAGANVLRATTSAVGLRSNLERSRLGRITSGQLSGRVHFRPASPLQHYNFISLFEASKPYEGFALVITDDVLQAYSERDDVSAYTPNPIVANAWNCAEFTITIDDTAGVVEFSLNGGTRVRVEGLDTRVASGYEFLGVGVTYAPPLEGPGNIDIDEVIISRLPLPCD